MKVKCRFSVLHNHQNHSKSRIKEEKEDEYSTGVAKIQVSAMFRAGDIRRNVLVKFIRVWDAMFRVLLRHKYGGRKLTKTLHRVCYKKPVVVFWGLINIYMSTYSHARTDCEISADNSPFFRLHYSILGRHFNIASRKGLDILPCFIKRRKTPSNWKFAKR